MESVSERYLREHSDDVLDRIARGETVIVTRDGVEVAELRRRPRRCPSAADLIAHRRHLPRLDPRTVVSDVDNVVDATL